ncbi:hypothetical protein L209DRAFT_20083 [Thermothelomyces heterothallicus CBS 203.75]
MTDAKHATAVVVFAVPCTAKPSLLSAGAHATPPSKTKEEKRNQGSSLSLITPSKWPPSTTPSSLATASPRSPSVQIGPAGTPVSWSCSASSSSSASGSSASGSTRKFSPAGRSANPTSKRTHMTGVLGGIAGGGPASPGWAMK